MGAFTELVRVAATFGFDVEDHVFADETNGERTHALHRIRVRTDLAPAHRTKTLAHELAHALLHMDATDRALAELEAESITFIVCDALGIQSDAWSFGSVAGWSGGGDQAIAVVKSAGTRIQRTADQLLSTLDGAEEARSQQVGGSDTLADVPELANHIVPYSVRSG